MSMSRQSEFNNTSWKGNALDQSKKNTTLAIHVCAAFIFDMPCLWTRVIDSESAPARSMFGENNSTKQAIW